MRRFVALATIAVLGLGMLSVLSSRHALAAGAVEMQVDRIVTQTIDAYNEAMEAGDPAGWLKYFTDNVRRHDPLGDQQGKTEFGDYYGWEFKSFQARCITKKIIISGRSAAVVFVWDARQRSSGATLQMEMVGIYELGPSGKFDSLSFYYDTAQAGKLLAESRAASK